MMVACGHGPITSSAIPDPVAIFGEDVVLYLGSHITASITNSSGDASAHADQGALDNDVSQSNAAKRPLITTGSDSAGMLQFTASSEDHLSREAASFTGTPAGTHVCVYWIGGIRSADNVVAYLLDVALSHLDGNGFALYHTSGGGLTFRAQLTGGAYPDSATWAAHAPPTTIEYVRALVTEEGTASNVELSVNGSVVATSNDGSADGDGLQESCTTMRLSRGVGEYADMDFYALVIVNRAPTAGEETQMQAWANSVWPTLSL